jgi:hypothetical protein
MDDYKKVDAEYQLHESFHPFPLCGFQCVQMIQRWRDAHHLIDSSLKYIFDRGDQHRGQLSKAVDKVGVDPIFRDKLKFPPLQAADYAAYEVYKAYKQIRLETDELFKKFRESFGLLRNIHHEWGEFNEQSLRVFCRLQRIPRR